MNIRKLKRKIISEIPIYDVIASRIEPKGHEFMCPFHGETTIGSFKIDKKANRFKCFTCDKGGDAINFIMEYDHVDFNKAVITIALMFGLIGEKEVSRYINNDTPVVNKSFKPLSLENKTIKPASIAVLDAVYDALIRLNPLSEVHRQTLTNRGITDEQIKAYRFFTMNGNDVSTQIEQEAILWHVDINELSRVPGFYLQDGHLKMINFEGIGLPIMSDDGMIQAIQVRKDTVDEKGSRYIFFSSRSKGGASSGGPIGTVFSSRYIEFNKKHAWSMMTEFQKVDTYRKEVNNNEALKTLIITEGLFKAIKLCNTMRNDVITLTVQGVNNVSNLPQLVQKLHNLYSIEQIVIAFDADFITNSNVAKAILKIDQQLHEVVNVPVVCMIWNLNQGKGIDDYLNNHHNASGLYMREAKPFIAQLRQYHQLHPIIDKKDKQEVCRWVDEFFQNVFPKK